MYKICPSCKLNYIKTDEEICQICLPPIKHISKNQKIEADFRKIKLGAVYGTSTRKIYEMFCKTLNWDLSQADACFGWQKPLYAKNADTTREKDVWFIFYPNYDKNQLDTVVNDFHVVNLIQDEGETIIEIVADEVSASNNADRITFVRTNIGYEFFGVYRIVKNGTVRIYKRIYKKYPID